jgi:nucleoside-diphosphate-sugar epimerase/acyl carrier protein
VLTCYVATEGPADAAGEDTPARLRLALRQLLPVSLVPDSIVVLDRLPLTPSGKVDRRALPAPDAARTSRSSVGCSPGPRDDVERAVADIWQEVLGRDASSVADDFFALGGHSLLATRIAARLRDRFGVEVPLRRLLDQPTIAGMARAVADGERPHLPPLGTLAHDHADPAPLTAAQEQVWWVSQDPMASLAYHVHAVTPLAGQASTQELAAAVAALTERHCVLRTTYPVTDGRPWLHVDDRWRSEFDEIRVPADAAVRDFLDSEARRPFPLASAPPVRWRVVRRPAGPALLMLTAHHISLDGWSVELLLRELAAMRDGADLPPAPCFSAVARWQRRALASAEVDAQRRYWRQRLGTSRGDAVLPSVSVPPSRPDFRGDVVRGTVPGAAGDLARRLGTTLFTVLLAAFAVQLRGHSGNDDICVGVPMAARRLRELEDVAGMLANTVVLRCDLSGEPTFAEAVRRVRHAVFEAHSHQDVPFAQVVSDAGRRPGAGRNPFYQALFGFDTAPHWHERAHNGTVKLDLSVLAAPGADGADIGISWEYATQALDKRTAEGMAAGYAALVADACENPERRISDLAPVKAAPRRAAAPPPVPRAGRLAATSAQGLIAAAFAEVLGVAGIGADDDFFALGGHSLMAARAIAVIGDRLGTPLPPRLLMEHPTVAGLAAVIERQAPLRPAPARRDGQLVLVTGGTGLVGGAVAAELRRRGLRVRVLARPASRDRARSVADEVAEGDLAEPDSLAEAATGVGAIVHAACTFTQPDVDVAAMARLAECAAGRPFVFVSSADVYGQPDSRPVAEDQPLPETVSAYARAKADCERLLAASAGPGFALLRPPYVWAPGPYCVWQLRETAGAPVERAARSGAPLVLPPPGRGHAWVDARDLAWAAAECLASPPGGPLNVIGGHFDWRDLAAALIRLRGLDVRCVDGQPEGLYATHRRFDGSLAAARFGFAPRRDWAATLAAAFRAANAGTAEQ